MRRRGQGCPRVTRESGPSTCPRTIRTARRRNRSLRTRRWFGARLGSCRPVSRIISRLTAAGLPLRYHDIASRRFDQFCSRKTNGRPEGIDETRDEQASARTVVGELRFHQNNNAAPRATIAWIMPSSVGPRAAPRKPDGRRRSCGQVRGRKAGAREDQARMALGAGRRWNLEAELAALACSQLLSPE